MKVLIQRTNNSSVIVDRKIVGQISDGLVVFVGFCEEDDEEVGGRILSVSQFTLYADTKKGNRPSYKKALKSELSKELYSLFNEKLRKYTNVETGIFGADMLVNISNCGPTSIIIER